MTEPVSAPQPTPVRKPELLSPLIMLSWANAIIVLLMALLGGRWLVQPEIIEMHGYIGNVFFIMVLLQAGLLIMAGIGGSMGKVLTGLAAVSVLLVIAQLGLGYSTRSSGAGTNALAFHIPNGVLIFGLSVAIVAQLPHLRARERQG